MYYFARLARDIEERLVILFRQSKVIGGLIAASDRKGSRSATAYALERRDAVLPLIRNMGALMTIGVRPLEIFLPVHGEGDLQLPRPRSQHPHRPPARWTRTPTEPRSIVVVADQHARRLDSRRRRHRDGRAACAAKPRVAMAWIGDGATSTGAFHEGLNFAAVQKLPLVVVAEDNKYAYSTPIAKQMAITRIDERAASYGIPHEIVDGNDMLAVYDVAKRMVDRARGGGGASLIGVDTMRMQGHAQHDDARYVPKAMLEEWAAKDPIAALQAGAARARRRDREGARRHRQDGEGATQPTEADLAVEEPMPDPATRHARRLRRRRLRGCRSWSS